MTDKTKKKIEAMAKKSREKYPESAAYYNAIEVATPWAEWCERFEKHIEKMIHENYGSCKEDIVILTEYQSWLEEKP